MTSTCTSLVYITKPNLIAINQSNQQFWDIFLIEQTVVIIQCTILFDNNKK